MSQPHNTVRTYALVATTVTSLAVIGIAIWLIDLLSGPNWCSRAIGADNAVEGVTRSQASVDGCLTLLSQQVSALALNSHIALGVLALCLAALMIIVVAGGRLSFKGSLKGVEGTMSSADDAAAAAAQVATAAQDEADVIAQDAPLARHERTRPDDPDGGT